MTTENLDSRTLQAGRPAAGHPASEQLAGEHPNGGHPGGAAAGAEAVGTEAVGTEVVRAETVGTEAVDGRALGVDALAVVVARGGQLPAGAAEAAAEAGGPVLVLGSGAAEAAAELADGGADPVWFADTGPGLRAGAVALALAPVLADVGLVVLPASPDGRDLAPRLAAALGRPLLAAAVSVRPQDTGAVPTAPAATGHPTAGHPSSGYPPSGYAVTLSRLESRLLVETAVRGPAVVTLLPGVRSVPPVPPGEAPRAKPTPLPLAVPDARQAAAAGVLDVEVLQVLEPDPATMDLSEAVRVLGGGAGLVAHAGDGTPQGRDEVAKATFELLTAVAAALGASAGATRVVTDAGWMGYDRQIGTTGVAVDPDLYIAFGVSGASQHTGGLGSPRHVVSVNLDPSCPMTAMADLGLVTDAADLLVELARRLGVAIPDALRERAAAGEQATGQEASRG